MATQRQRRAAQSGSAYDLPEPSYDAELVEVGRGKPCGELLRRYWQPIATAGEVKDLPLAVRALGEDLVLFRTPEGKFGLVYPRCCHRGTTLMYGKIEDRGIRCCYHGWLFDVEGRCLEQPCEPGGGAKRENYRQPWYPVQERYGLVFAYMGPLDRMPVLPRYDILEDLAEDEKLVANGRYLGADPATFPCNWLQIHENAMDSWHVYVLHSTFSNVQFNEIMTVRPEIKWEATDNGSVAFQIRKMPDGNTMRRMVEIRLPNVMSVPDPTLRSRKPFGKAASVRWTLPIDDSHSRSFVVGKWAKDAPPFRPPAIYNGKSWEELDSEAHQRNPGDYEAQTGQGPVTLHSEEHLASSDRGVSMYRRMLREQIEIVRKGDDPLNLEFDGSGVVGIRAGNFIIAPDAAAA